MATPEEANQAIGDAVEAWVNTLEDETDGQGPGVLGDWVVVACMVDVKDGVPVGNYYVAMKTGNMLPHVAQGLLSRGIDELEGMEQDL